MKGRRGATTISTSIYVSIQESGHTVVWYRERMSIMVIMVSIVFVEEVGSMMYYTYIYVLLNDSENNISSIKMYIKFHENLIFVLEI